MAATVVFNKQQKCWYLIDRHPSHKNGRKATKLGPDEKDRLEGLEIAAHKNAKREREEATRQAQARALIAGAPIYGRDAFPQMLEATKARRGAPHDKNVRLLIARHVLPHLKDVDLRRLTEDDVAELAAKILRTPKQVGDDNCGRATVDTAMKQVAKCLHWLGKKRDANFEVPVTGLQAIGRAVAKTEKAPAARSMVSAYTREEADALLAALAARHEPLHNFVFVALHTGARYGEIVALEWGDVDFAAGELHITKNIERVSEERTSPKSGKARVFFMGAALVEHLRRMQTRRRWLKSDRLLVNSYGDPWGLGGPSMAWQRFCDWAEAQGLRTLNFHCWRHTYVSWGLHAGVSQEEMAQQIGDTVTTMRRHYSHWLRKEARRNFVDFMSAGVAAPSERAGLRLLRSESEAAAETEAPGAA